MYAIRSYYGPAAQKRREIPGEGPAHAQGGGGEGKAEAEQQKQQEPRRQKTRAERHGRHRKTGGQIERRLHRRPAEDEERPARPEAQVRTAEPAENGAGRRSERQRGPERLV